MEEKVYSRCAEMDNQKKAGTSGSVQSGHDQTEPYEERGLRHGGKSRRISSSSQELQRYKEGRQPKWLDFAGNNSPASWAGEFRVEAWLC